MSLNDSIYDLKGVGDKVGAKLVKAGIMTLRDLVEFYPREYEDRRAITRIDECQIDESNNILARVCSNPTVVKKGSKIIVSFRVKEASGAMSIPFLN